MDLSAFVKGVPTSHLVCELGLLLIAGIASAQDRDVAAEFKSAKANLTAQLRGKRSNRLEAVQKLEAYPIVEAAKLLVVQGLTSDDIEVRRATFDLLVKFSSHPEIADYLKTSVTAKWKSAKVQPETLTCMGLLLAAESSDHQAEAVEMVKTTAKRPNRGRIVLITLADELATLRGDSACKALTPLVGLDLFDDDFAFRRAVVQALAQVRCKPAIPALIRALGSVRGEVRADIVQYLGYLSGKQFGDDVRGWLTWWEENQEKFEFPPEPEEGRPLAAVAPQTIASRLPGSPSYYGLPLYGSQIVFVIDASGSMRGEQIVAAKRELVRAIEGLPNDVMFNVIAFNTRNYVWQKKLVAASAENKQGASYFVASLGLGNGTASYDALDAALQFDAEAIYFLTDGAPVGGRITNPADIVRTITRDNQFRRMTINSIGIGVGPPGSVFDAFLSTLAQQNFGAYERVDQ